MSQDIWAMAVYRDDRRRLSAVFDSREAAAASAARVVEEEADGEVSEHEVFQTHDKETVDHVMWDDDHGPVVSIERDTLFERPIDVYDTDE